MTKEQENELSQYLYSAYGVSSRYVDIYKIERILTPKWISVEEKLPDHEVMQHSKQLMCYSKGDMLIGYTYVKYGELHCENEETILKGVTHYMQVPEPPEPITNTKTN